MSDSPRTVRHRLSSSTVLVIAGALAGALGARVMAPAPADAQSLGAKVVTISGPDTHDILYRLLTNGRLQALDVQDFMNSERKTRWRGWIDVPQ